MKATAKIWIFYDKSERKQSKPMSTVQAQMELLAMRPAELADYLIWTPGWQQWHPLDTFLQSSQQVFVMAPKIGLPAHVDAKSTLKKSHSSKHFTEVDKAAKLHTKEDYGYFYQEFSAEKIDVDAKPIPMQHYEEQEGRERRLYDRHPMKLEVILLGHNGKAFRSHSVNISVSGTLLEEEIPKAYFNTQFDLVIVNRFEKNPKLGRLQFQGKIVGDFADPRRLMFLEASPEMLERLSLLIQNYETLSKKFDKKTG